MRCTGKAQLMMSMVFMGDSWKQRGKLLGTGTQGKTTFGWVIPEMTSTERGKLYQSCWAGAGL